MAGFFKKLLDVFKRKPLDFDELEATLIAGDLGLKMTLQIIARLRSLGRELHAEDIVTVARQEISQLLSTQTVPLTPFPDRPKVVLIVGVNGVGKTTSVAKLAQHLQGQQHGVVLAAADTFRAAAIEQLEVWAQRIQVPLVKSQFKGDPAAVCFDAWESAQKRNAQFLLCDTAGRLHNRHNLMEELAKIRRTLAKKDPSAPHETLLVVDATTGSNALNQAREFDKSVGGLTGLIVTKLDGSGKGGVIVSIQQELGIPTRYIGTGEGAKDLEIFDPIKFVNTIL